MNRYRHTGSIAQLMTRHYKNLLNGYESTVTGVVPANYEFIADEYKDPRHFKNCHHMQVFIDPDMGFFIDGVHQNQPKYGLFGAFSWQEPLDNVITNYLTPSGEELEGFNKRAFDAMKPGIEVAMDLPTFLAEIKDLPKLFDSRLLKKIGLQKLDVKEITWNLKKFKGKMTKFVEDLSVKEESFTKSLAGDFLAYSFGIAPTVADAKGLWKGFVEIDKKLDDLLARAGTPCKRHYAERIVRPVYTLPVQVGPYSDTLTIKYLGGKMQLNATSLYTYVLNNVQAMSAFMKRALAYLSMLGFDNPARTIWELVPFSFVLDWFIPVGDFLEQLRMDYFDTTVKIDSYCISFKTVEPHTIEYTFKRSSTGTSFKIGKIHYGLYRRCRALPNDDMFGLRIDNNFGTKQMLLSGALLTSIFGR